MVGEGQLKEQARQQWERLNTEGVKIINKPLTADTENLEWPEDAEPKFTRKKATRATKVTYNAKTKRYMYYNSGAVTAGGPVRLDIPDLFLYFSYHPVKKNTLRSMHLLGMSQMPSTSWQHLTVIGFGKGM